MRAFNRVLHSVLAGGMFAVLSVPAAASTFFFPEIKPTVTAGESPQWLHDGRGNDGYVSVVSEVVPASACMPLSNRSFWGGEKTQLVLSIQANGFRKDLDNKEIPIATFDGRDDGSECATLSTLPINVVPLTLLGSHSTFNPGKLSIVLNVKSANDSKHDFVGSAKLLLGAAAMVVSGGTAATVGGIAATVGNPVLSETQSKANELSKEMVNGKTPVALSWAKLRNGLRAIEIPVYRAESGMTDSTEKKIQQLQSDSKLSRTTLFTVRLTFNFVNSLFDPGSSGAEELFNSDTLSPSTVLNSPALNSPHNFLQVLNDGSPSLLLAAASAQGRELSNVCSTGFERLKKLGLSAVDTAIVMKSFLDEAKGGAGWYGNPAIVKSCFAQVPTIQAYLERLYGVSTPKFVVGDMQDGIGNAYREWRDKTGPALTGFKKALSAYENRSEALLRFNANNDIKLTVSPEIRDWPPQAGDTPYPGIEMLARQGVRSAGCFIYKDAANLAPGSMGAYLILGDQEGHYWLGSLKLAHEGAGKIASLEIAELTSDWVRHFKSYSYLGTECETTLARIQPQTTVLNQSAE